MSINIDEKYLKPFVSDEEIKEISNEVIEAYYKVLNKNGAGSDFLGWINLPESIAGEEYQRIKAAAKRIRSMCDVLIVIGIGGSYLGARAAIEFIHSSMYNTLAKDSPKIYFVGNNLDGTYLSEILEVCKGKDICVNVISKSGTTTEPSVAFRIFRKLLEDKYGKDASKRIFATTDKSRGKLKELADRMGYECFVVPDDVGGRYSVLSAVGLLPIAVSGADIDKIMKGASDAKKELSVCDVEKNAAMKYAALRNILYRGGKKTEILVSYDNSVQMLQEWWKQLYGESEGKDGKGIYPASVIFSTDLHSLGQYIQQGERTLFETVLVARNAKADIEIQADADNADGLGFLDGMKMSELNMTAYVATALAHSDGGVPNIAIEYDARDEYNFGYLVYFFELACAVSGYTLGVNPFDQPGVEAYKKNMYALLGKPGKENEDRRAELLARLSK